MHESSAPSSRGSSSPRMTGAKLRPSTVAGMATPLRPRSVATSFYPAPPISSSSGTRWIPRMGRCPIRMICRGSEGRGPTDKGATLRLGGGLCGRSGPRGPLWGCAGHNVHLVHLVHRVHKHVRWGTASAIMLHLPSSGSPLLALTHTLHQRRAADVVPDAVPDAVPDVPTRSAAPQNVPGDSPAKWQPPYSRWTR